MTKTAVVALGGNALTLPGQAGTCEEMLARAADMAASVNDIIEAGWRVVIVHGNGPQVGSLALQQEATALVPPQPLAMLGAMTQGQLGSMLTLAVDRLRGPGSAASLITHVTVDPADPAFGAPTKPIGPFFERDQAERLAAERGWTVQPDSGHGYRRVVASPQPVGIVEIAAIRALVDAGVVVIAAGGGGIPLVTGPGGPMSTEPAAGPMGDGSAGAGRSLRAALADAVIDKDRAARLLATLIGAQALLLVTAVDRVMLTTARRSSRAWARSRPTRWPVTSARASSRRAAWVPRSRRPCSSWPTEVTSRWSARPDGGPGGGTRITPSPSRVGHGQ
jgi:carbamate kinase